MVLVLLLLILAALYEVFRQVLRQVARYELVALVAKQQIFAHLFLVLAVMLAFSNAILAFGSLFGRQEAGHLLATPAPPRQVVCLKWLEGLALSSWAFLLLGVPLMLAMGSSTSVAWYYYPLFVGHFFGFVIIPSTLGLLAAWAVAMWAPRRPRTILIGIAGVLAVVAGLWGWNLVHHGGDSDLWVQRFYGQLGLARWPLLPSAWSAKGVFAALEGRAARSMFYLGVVLANGAFLGWLTVNLIGPTWGQAYSRATQGTTCRAVRNGWFTAAACAVLFPYLRPATRTLMLKDLRSFARDPTQWTQMVIMLGLLTAYALNLKRLPIDLGGAGMRAVVAFLNLTTVSLILATFTSRFVFPLLSLESQQLWLLGLLPVRRRDILWVKFAFSLTVTGLSAVLVMALAVRALELPMEWAYVQIAVALGVCVGLSGLSVGLGARFPVFGQRNPARIASGFGGTVNLVASMLFVAVEMAGLAYAGLLHFGAAEAGPPSPHRLTAVALGLLMFSIVVAWLGLRFGARHFERLEY